AGVATAGALTVNQLSGGAAGSGATTISIRPDILADTSATGLGSGFAAWFPTTGIRPLTAAELAQGLYRPISTNANVSVSGTQTVGTATVNSLTMNAGGKINIISTGATFTDSTGGFLALENSAGSVSGGLFSTGGNQAFFFQQDTTNALDFNAYLLTSNQIIKAGLGTMNLLKPQVFQQQFTIFNMLGGTLNLNSGVNNTLPVVSTATTPYVTSLLLNNGLVDLKGNNQVLGNLYTNNAIAGAGGVITNSSGTLATLTSAYAASQSFAGSITGNLAFTRSGNNTTTLTNTNSYNGATIVRGGVLELKDQGALTATTSLTDYFGTLQLNDQGLNSGINRLATTVPLTLAGATLNYLGNQTSASVGTVNVSAGQSVVSVSTMTGNVAVSGL
ncbi:MAG: hypothetical protein EBR81_17040, partial [Proteobacteria bacterium]|nr:hypothetical protein [Pseudomonadota bacterium]